MKVKTNVNDNVYDYTSCFIMDLKPRSVFAFYPPSSFDKVNSFYKIDKNGEHFYEINNSGMRTSPSTWSVNLYRNQRLYYFPNFGNE